MKYLLSLIIMFAWAIWFGGNIALFIFISAMFRERHDIAGQVGQVLFPTFERWAIPTAALALCAIVGIRLSTKQRGATIMFLMLGLSAVMLVVSSAVITPQIASMFSQGLQKTAAFRKLHGWSMLVNFSQAIFLALAGCLLPAVLAGQYRPRCSGSGVGAPELSG